MSLDKTIQTLILVFVSYQGLLLLIDPEHRNKLHSTVAAVNEVGVPLVQSIAEHGRILVALALIPTCLYPRTWFVPKFVSIMAYVIYICIIYNLYLFHSVQDVALLLFQLYVLVKTLFILVEDLTTIEAEERDQIRKRLIEKRQALAKSHTRPVAPAPAAEIKSKKQQEKVQRSRTDKPKKP